MMDPLQEVSFSRAVSHGISVLATCLFGMALLLALYWFSMVEGAYLGTLCALAALACAYFAQGLDADACATGVPSRVFPALRFLSIALAIASVLCSLGGI